MTNDNIQSGHALLFFLHAKTHDTLADTLTLDIPKGNYDLQFFNPSTGNFIGTKKSSNKKHQVH